MISPARRRNDGDTASDLLPVRVLLVDDDEDFRVWMGLLMRRLGFDVSMAADGEEALSLLRQASFDLLVADLEMPRMNGLDLVREIRGSPVLSHQYAVMLTSHEDVDSKVMALSAGYDDFLAKSCSEVEVVARVAAAKRLIARQRMLSVAAREWQTLATRDELTGVTTRRTLMEEGQKALVTRRTVALVIFDLDDFKPVNDSYGHLAGDRILRDVGALFLSRTRAHDVIGRYGGDEFVLLLLEQSLDEVTAAAQRLVHEIEHLQWTIDGKLLQIKVTAGLAHSSLLSQPTLEQLLDVADRELYAKKWLKKHPGENRGLYDYPPRAASADIVPLPPPPSTKRPELKER